MIGWLCKGCSPNSIDPCFCNFSARTKAWATPRTFPLNDLGFLQGDSVICIYGLCWIQLSSFVTMMSAVRGCVRELDESEPTARGSFFGPGLFFVLGANNLSPSPGAEIRRPRKI